MITVTQLIVYPFKSCKGVSIKQTGFDQEGLLNDRRLMAVDAKGTFMTARSTPDLLQLGCLPTANGWELSHPKQACNITITESDLMISGQIWRDTFDAADGGDEAANWLSEALGQTCRIALWKPAARHSAKYNLDTTFADAAPILIASEASMQQGCDWAGIPYDVRRFRPNIVITGVEAFEEEQWQRFSIADTTFDMIEACSRCILTTRDPDTSVAHPDKQPMKVLMQKHANDQGQPLMGMNARLTASTETASTETASITVGDELILL